MIVNALEDKKMREIGFTDHNEDYWYYCRNLGNEITFNLSMRKDGFEYKIDVLDEDFGQPYDYQYYLSQNPASEFALRIKEKVEEIMLELGELGVVFFYERGDYI